MFRTEFPLKHSGLVSPAYSISNRSTSFVAEPNRWEIAIEQSTTEIQIPGSPTVISPDPKGRVVIRQENKTTNKSKSFRLICTVYFDYGDGLEVLATSPENRLSNSCSEVALVRNKKAERRLLYQLLGSGAKLSSLEEGLKKLIVPKNKLTALVLHLTKQGWAVEAQGIQYHQVNEFKIKVDRKMDWLELNGGAGFEHMYVPIARLLSQINRGSGLINLDDGSMGIIPKQWLKRCKSLLDLGEAAGDKLLFSKNKALLLDSLLAQQEEVEYGASFKHLCQQLSDFEGIEAIHEGNNFDGTLRPYQRKGLGWFVFLRSFKLGGILADDMGLGKTVQCLAFIERLRASRLAERPHLVIAPRSLIANWIKEAKNFIPGIKITEYLGCKDNSRTLQSLANTHELILCSYSIMRNSILKLKEVSFDLLILDEAQVIKNKDSQTYKAARLLQAEQRLALSGTPIENDLDELASIMKFLNPGMLKMTSSSNSKMLGDEKDRKVFLRSVQPLILRRTKETVLTELPEKLEQSIYCEMEGKHAELYAELKAHYRQKLINKALHKPKNHGSMAKTIFTALTRLRQAACHPALLDKSRLKENSTKLDTLLSHLETLIKNGSKALVFSQFTSFLGIIRDRLESLNIDFAYLDGSTAKRDEVVSQFQTQPNCKVFLISLKAGGLGLNLTAADYAFIMDPWWNSAAESQAIDRAYRIGQKKKVFAFKFITRSTIEEKVVKLQRKKKATADMYVHPNEDFITSLSAKDLEYLFK